MGSSVISSSARRLRSLVPTASTSLRAYTRAASHHSATHHPPLLPGVASALIRQSATSTIASPIHQSECRQRVHSSSVTCSEILPRGTSLRLPFALSGAAGNVESGRLLSATHTHAHAHAHALFRSTVLPSAGSRTSVIQTRSVYVEVKKGDVERAIKRYKWKLRDANIIRVARARRYYWKPAEMKVLRAKEEAIRRKKKEYGKKLGWIMTKKQRGF